MGKHNDSIHVERLVLLLMTNKLLISVQWIVKEWSLTGRTDRLLFPDFRYVPIQGQSESGRPLRNEEGREAGPRYLRWLVWIALPARRLGWLKPSGGVLGAAVSRVQRWAVSNALCCCCCCWPSISHSLMLCVIALPPACLAPAL